MDSVKVKSALTALLLLSVVGAGVAAAAGPTFADETLSVSDDTRSVYAEVENLNNSDGVNATARVVVYGLDEDSVATELKNTTVSPTGANETAMVEQSVNASAYPEYRVVVSSDQTNTTAERADVGSLEEVAGGSGGSGGSLGGFSLGGASNGQLLGIVVIALAVVGYIKRE